mmetsp:Transcript_870/g.1853  ORF Transcript_870/g.1853 Transcript_870/m.1853 type:complete len:146 (-) Transcript_870:274-711(-)
MEKKAGGTSNANEEAEFGHALSFVALSDLGEHSKSKIQISKEKKPLNFFLHLAKKFLQDEEEVELSAMGLAVTSAVTIAEILKAQGIAEIARITTGLVESDQQDRKSSSIPKAKIQIWIRRGHKLQHCQARPYAATVNSGNEKQY